MPVGVLVGQVVDAVDEQLKVLHVDTGQAYGSLGRSASIDRERESALGKTTRLLAKAVASGSTKTEVPKPVNANAEQSQVRYSKAGGLAWDSTEWIAGGPRWGQLCGSTLNFVAVEYLRFIEWLRRIAFTTSIDGIDREADEG